MKRSGFRIRSRISGNQVKLRDRNVKLGFVGIIDLKELSRAVRRIHRGKTAVAADAVLQVHDRVTDFQLRQITDHHVDVAFAFGASAFSSDRAFAARIKFGFRQNGDRRILKMHSVIERSVAEREFLAAFKERFEILRGRNRKFVFFQDFRMVSRRPAELAMIRSLRPLTLERSR